MSDSVAAPAPEDGADVGAADRPVGEIVVVHGAGVQGEGPLEELLAARGRATRVVPAQSSLTTVGVRALALRGDPGAAHGATITTVVTSGAPVLAIGGAVAAFAQSSGGAVEMTPGDAAAVLVTATAEGADHPVAGALPAGARWLADVTISGADGWTVLARADGGEPVLLERGSVLLCALRCDLSRSEVAALLGDEPRPVTAARFIVAAGAALLGRWVDRSVGRTAEEAPWGRRGPGPVPRPGLSLHPA